MTRWYADRRDRTGESGAVAVVVAFTSILLFSFAAIVVDLGMTRDHRVRLQTAADAAALAATDVLYVSGTAVPDLTGAVSAARTYIERNTTITAADWLTCTDPTRPAGYVASPTPCISFSPSLTRPGVVRVVLPVRSNRTVFAGVIGVAPPPVTAIAEASLRVNRQAPCALCVLGGGTHNFGQGDVRVSGGNIALNGSVTVGANGMVAASPYSILVEGTTSGAQHASPPPVNGSTHLDDPLADYPLPLPPSYAAPTPLTAKTNPCSNGSNGGPGIYGSFNFPSGVTCTLSPGLYVIAGSSSGSVTAAGTWDMSGTTGTILRGTGVTLLFTCGTSTAPRACNPDASGAGLGEYGASLTVSGSASLDLTGPQTGPLAGFTILFDRNNRGYYKVAGGGSSTIHGSVYMPKGTAVMNGNGCIDAYSVLFIANDLVTNGNGSCLNMTYDRTLAAQLQPDQLRLTR